MFSVDGCLPNCRSKFLFAKVFYFSVYGDAPTRAPLNRWLLLDGAGRSTAPGNSAQSPNHTALDFHVVRVKPVAEILLGFAIGRSILFRQRAPRV